MGAGSRRVGTAGAGVEAAVAGDRRVRGHRHRQPGGRPGRLHHRQHRSAHRRRTRRADRRLRPVAQQLGRAGADRHLRATGGPVQPRPTHRGRRRHTDQPGPCGGGSRLRGVPRRPRDEAGSVVAHRHRRGHRPRREGPRHRSPAPRRARRLGPVRARGADRRPGRRPRHRRADLRGRPVHPRRRHLVPRQARRRHHRTGSLLMKLLTKRRNLNSATASPADTAGLASFVGPAAVEHMPRHLKVGDGYAATLIVTGYPAEVGAAWLDPLLAWPGRLDVVVYIDPLAPQIAAVRLRKQRARLESNRRGDAERGRLADRIARGQSKLFRVGLYLCVHAPTLTELDEAVAHVRATAASVLLDTQPATWRQLQGWLATLPLASDGLGMRRVMDTDAIATAFPLASADLPAPLPGEAGPAGGMLYGLNPDSNGVVWWDRWSQHNANSVVLARSGAGKSYFIKLEVLRSLADGVHVAVIDPDNEYIRLAEA